MGRIAVHEFMTLDGVVETPSWTMDHPFVPAMGEAISSLMAPGTELLLGRRTYEMFEPAWSTRTAEEDPGAPFMNGSAKHVVSSTLDDPSWSNSSVLGPYDAKAISALKERTPGLYVSGSVQLVRAMLRDGLVDELHLFVYPVVLGSGLRLFEQGSETLKLKLAASEAFENEVVHLTYAPAV
jgi:dihydrofolate reductase